MPSRKARRVQLSRTAGWRLPAGAVSVAYPTKWANPFRPAARTPAANATALEQYRTYLAERPDLVACWCTPELPCHADLLLAVAAGEAI
jgi:hypothetical protein